MPGSFLVHIVDDDEAVHQLLAFLLSTAGIPVRVYDSATSLLASLATLQNGRLITDVRMPDMTGIELLQRLRAKNIKLPVIVITGQGDIPLAVEAMKSGAIDFIEKPFAEEAILRAVRAAEDRAKKLGRRSEEEVQVAARLASLSERERQVLDGLVAGNANKIIAHELGIGPRTVEVYRANLMTKMQAKSLSELIRMTLTARALD
jgi:two-component system response regulator FixJ